MPETKTDIFKDVSSFRSAAGKNARDISVLRKPITPGDVGDNHLQTPTSLKLQILLENTVLTRPDLNNHGKLSFSEGAQTGKPIDLGIKIPELRACFGEMALLLYGITALQGAPTNRFAIGCAVPASTEYQKSRFKIPEGKPILARHFSIAAQKGYLSLEEDEKRPVATSHKLHLGDIIYYPDSTYFHLPQKDSKDVEPIRPSDVLTFYVTLD